MKKKLSTLKSKVRHSKVATKLRNATPARKWSYERPPEPAKGKPVKLVPAKPVKIELEKPRELYSTPKNPKTFGVGWSH